MKTLKLLVFTILVVASGCKKHEDAPAAGAATASESAGSATASAGSATAPAGSATMTAGSTTAPMGSAAMAGSANAVDENADHITVLAHHKNPKPTDPVRINFESFKVVKASFDPKKIEGGTATVEIDLASFHTQSDERDNHLRSPAYLDVGKFATATIDIDNVHHKAGATYKAVARVTAHGITNTFPVEFDVIDTKDDSIRIKGEQSFSRLDFSIGSDPKQNPDEQVATDMKIEMVLTLKKG